MKPETARELSRLANEHNARREADKAKAAEAVENKRAREERFRACVREAIRPVLNDFQELVRSWRYHSEIKEGAGSPFGIVLTVSIPGLPGISHISFEPGQIRTAVADPRSEEGEACEPDELSTDFVEERVKDFLAQLLRSY